MSVRRHASMVAAVLVLAGSAVTAALAESVSAPGGGCEGAIDVWYGSPQSFGTPGIAQRWVNILGTVRTDGLEALAYSLNGGSGRPLAVGGDTRRLDGPGDFNVDVGIDELDGGPGDDVVSLSALYGDGTSCMREVTVAYEAGHRFPQDYAIDWSRVGRIQEVVQVVDGHWVRDGDGVRAETPGYDRFFALGDRHWDFFELRTSVTTHDLETEDPRGRDGGVFGIGLLWNGHTDDPIEGWQPKSGWNPLELLVYDSTPEKRFRIFGREGNYPVALEEGRTYDLVFRTEQVNAFDRTLRLKIWEAGSGEPADWLIDEAIELPEPRTGALILLSHYYDVTFNRIEVTAHGGGDIVTGEDGLLVAVDASAERPGQGEIDVFVGSPQADAFVAGQDGTVYYDDGVADRAGEADYALIWNLGPGDRIRLAGGPGDYLLTEETPYAAEAVYAARLWLTGAIVPRPLERGTLVWRRGVDGGEDELVAVIRGVHGLDIAGDAFVYDP